MPALLCIELNVKYSIIAVLMFATTALGQSEPSARELFDRANQARAQAGVGELAWNAKLADIALAHAQMMADRKELSHQFPGEPTVRQRVISTGLRTNTSGENVAFAGEVEELFTGWMNSPPHKKNLLDPKYNATGIAVVRRGDTLYAVQDFARVLNAYSDNEVETIVATQLTRLRTEAKLPALKLIAPADVHPAACEMARDGRMEAAALTRRLQSVRSVYTFTTAEPQKLPERLPRFSPDARSFAVGSCFAKTDKFPEGTNWVVVAFY